MLRRDFWKLGGAGLVAAGASLTEASADVPGLAPFGGAPQKHWVRDLALINARIITLDPARPRAQAALVRGGRIVLVGSNQEVRGHAGGAPVFDAGGRTVTPGFIDTHTHFEKACLVFSGKFPQLRSPEYSTIAQMLTRLREVAKTTPPGRWIIARGTMGFHRIIDDKRYPTRQELDSVSEVHPIALQAGMHAILYNTMAFKKIGLWDPKEAAELRFRDGRRKVGTDVARDADGLPTGMTTESGDLVPLDAFTREELREAVVKEAIPRYTAEGVTSLMHMPSNYYDLPIDHALQAEGLLPIRLRTYYNVPLYFSLDAIIQSGLTPGVGNDMWRFGGIKHPVAGAGFDAYMRPVSDMKFTQEELDDYIWKSHDFGFQTCLHQAGESLPISLNAVERAQARQFKDLRHRLEHYSRLDDLDEIRRVKRLGMRVTITAQMERSPGPNRDRRFPRYATLIREGLEPVLISDSTGTIARASPLIGIAGVVAPQSEGGWSPEGEAPTLEQAVAMWTIWAARAQHEEAHKGSIEVGKLGDFVVLSGDIDRHPGGKLFDLKIDATILGGQVVYEA